MPRSGSRTSPGEPALVSGRTEPARFSALPPTFQLFCKQPVEKRQRRPARRSIRGRVSSMPSVPAGFPGPVVAGAKPGNKDPSITVLYAGVIGPGDAAWGRSCRIGPLITAPIEIVGTPSQTNRLKALDGRERASNARLDRRRDVMPSYKAPVEDVLFLLSDVFYIERYTNLP